jgi:hypothetical protein
MYSTQTKFIIEGMASVNGLMAPPDALAKQVNDLYIADRCATLLCPDGDE